MKDVQPTPDWLMQFNTEFRRRGRRDEAGRRSTASRTKLSFVCKPDGLRRPQVRGAVRRRRRATPMARSAARTSRRPSSAPPTPRMQDALAKATPAGRRRGGASAEVGIARGSPLGSVDDVIRPVASRDRPARSGSCRARGNVEHVGRHREAGQPRGATRASAPGPRRSSGAGATVPGARSGWCR